MESEGMGREEVCATISSLPSQLSHDDVEDFFSLAHYYAARTPQSFRKVSAHTHSLSLLWLLSRVCVAVLGLSQSDVWQWSHWLNSRLQCLSCSLPAHKPPGSAGL